jgi:hypothetical protein
MRLLAGAARASGLGEVEDRSEARAQAQPVYSSPQQHPGAPANGIVKRRAKKISDGVRYEQQTRHGQCGARDTESSGEN